MADKKTRKSSASRQARNEAYKASGRRDINKAIKLARHLRRHLLDYTAGMVFDAVPTSIKAQAEKVVAKRKAQLNVFQVGG